MASFIVLGSNSDFGNPPIEDALYSYLLNKWTIASPATFNVTDLDPDNKARDNMGQWHMYVQLLRTHGDRSTEPIGWIRYFSTLRIHLIMQRLAMGQIPNDMSRGAAEAERLLFMYSPHWIAGIDMFDNIDINPLDEPTDNPASPFNNTWHTAVDINAWYTKATDFQIDIVAYNPTLYTAGQLTYL